MGPKKMTLKEFYEDESLASGSSWADDDDDIDFSSIGNTSIGLDDQISRHQNYGGNFHHGHGGSPFGNNHPQYGYNSAPVNSSTGPPYILKFQNLPEIATNKYMEDLFNSRFMSFDKCKVLKDPEPPVPRFSHTAQLPKKCAFIQVSTLQTMNKILKWTDITLERARVFIQVADHRDFAGITKWNEDHGFDEAKEEERVVHLLQERQNQGPPVHISTRMEMNNESIPGRPPIRILQPHGPHSDRTTNHITNGATGAPLHPSQPLSSTTSPESPSKPKVNPFGNAKPINSPPQPLLSLHENIHKTNTLRNPSDIIHNSVSQVQQPVQPPKPKVNPFGLAKPVDNLARQRELDALLPKLKINDTTFKTLGALEREEAEAKQREEAKKEAEARRSKKKSGDSFKKTEVSNKTKEYTEKQNTQVSSAEYNKNNTSEDSRPPNFSKGDTQNVRSRSSSPSKENFLKRKPKILKNTKPPLPLNPPEDLTRLEIDVLAEMESATKTQTSDDTKTHSFPKGSRFYNGMPKEDIKPIMKKKENKFNKKDDNKSDSKKAFVKPSNKKKENNSFDKNREPKSHTYAEITETKDDPKSAKNVTSNGDYIARYTYIREGLLPPSPLKGEASLVADAASEKSRTESSSELSSSETPKPAKKPNSKKVKKDKAKEKKDESGVKTGSVTKEIKLEKNGDKTSKETPSSKETTPPKTTPSSKEASPAKKTSPPKTKEVTEKVVVAEGKEDITPESKSESHGEKEKASGFSSRGRGRGGKRGSIQRGRGSGYKGHNLSYVKPGLESSRAPPSTSSNAKEDS